MPKKTYQIIEDSEFLNLFEEVMNYEHNRLISSAKIKWGLLFYRVDDEDVDNLTLLPYTTKVASDKDNLLKNIHVESSVNYEYWAMLNSIEQKVALIDSIINSVNVVLGKDGEIVVKDNGFVKLKVKKPDIVYNGYSDIIEKYGHVSPEVKLMRLLKNFNPKLFENIV